MALYHETYDARAISDRAVIPDHADHYIDLGKRTGGPVLELGAGTARISKQLAAAGIDATALELSAEMIAAGKTSGEPVPDIGFRWLKADARAIPADRRYRLVIAPFRMLQELGSDADLRDVMKSVHAVLEPGGWFCFDMIDIDGMPSLRRNDASRMTLPDIRHPSTGRIVRVTACERIARPVARTYRERWHFAELGSNGAPVRQEEYWQRHRWYERSRIFEMLSALSFTGLMCYGSFQDVAANRQGLPGHDQIWFCKRPI